MARKNRNPAGVASISLYGTQMVGHGWLAETPDGTMFGDGEPRPGRSLTECVFEACRVLRKDGGHRGDVEVYEPTGRLKATTRADGPCWYGDMKWTEAGGYVLDVESLIAGKAVAL